MTGRIKKILKKLACVCISILFMTVSAKATLVDSNSSIVVDNIEYYMQTNKSVYDLGESVEMLHRVTNLRDGPLTFVFGAQQQCSFGVWDGETKIWYWPKNVSPGGSIFTLQPGEFKEFLQDWDMMNDNGTWNPIDDFLVSPGIYDVSGQVWGTTYDGIIPEFVSVPIQIIPEPSSLLLFAASFHILIYINKKRGL